MRIYSLSAALLTSGAIAVSSLSPAMAETTYTVNRATTPAAKLDKTTQGKSLRASTLIGMDIVNAEGETVAEINDLVLDARTGNIKYVAVTYGGFLGMGDKMFAVPYQAIHIKNNPQADNPNDAEPVLMLNVTEQQLEGAEGFDQEHWPDFSNRNFTKQLDDRYGVKPGHRDYDRDHDRDQDGVRVDVGRGGINVDVGK